MTRWICTVSGAALGAALAASPALAQEAVEELVVTGQRASQQLAIETKREALGVVDAIAADDIGRLADKNVAENLERLPGVGVAYDQGEGRYVSIRGTPSTLNNVTLNGVEVGNPDGDSRALPLDIVSGQLLGRLEVLKAVTPDRDAQGIGGTINLVTRSPFDSGKNLTAQVSAQVGYQEFNEKTPVQGDVTLGMVRGDWGALLGVSYSYRDYRSDGLFPDDWRTVPGVARGGLPINLKFTNYTLERERIGVSGAVEWRPSDDDRVFFRGLYSRFTENEYRQRFRLDFASNLANVTLNPDGTTGVARNVEARQDLRTEYKEKSLSTFQLGAWHVRGPWRVEYDVSWGYNELIEPNQLWLFRGGAATVDFDMGPLLYTATPRNLAASDLGFRQYTAQDESGEETNKAARFDLRRDLDMGNESFLKVGFKLRETDKKFDGRTDLFERAAAAANRFTLADFGLRGPDMAVSLGEAAYANRFVIDEDAIKAFTAQNLNGPRIVRNNATSLSNDTLSDYSLTERVAAGYAMANIDLGAVTVLAGWRVESTETDIRGFRLSGGVVTAVRRSGEYSDFLPNVHLRWTPAEDVIVRAAYTHTLGRPQYPQLRPGGLLTVVTNPDGTLDGELSEGNVDLDPFRSENFDLSVEWYFAPGGLLSAGAFLKRIDDPIFSFRETRTGVQLDGRTFSRLFYTQPQNAERGEIRGLEVQYQQQFTFLPGLWGGFGVAANVTLTDSDLTVPGRGELPFIGQSDLLWGAQLFYQKGPIEAALSYHHTGKAPQSIGGNLDADTFDDDYRRLNAKVSYALSDRVEVYVDLQNLTDEKLREYQGGREDWLTNYERYKRTYYVGVQARW
ncbi:MAG: TonB-dependent receptor [Phenylobacterium sp.]|uniref:TonB-dependent receptor n=1 Tax=Phenylobacterium sp. TaxID=1871053 RepID=UPI001A570635|nr:TonB-dependent receptor [Phenylobacterium sp.]MBL8771032.1 TonB-dependent receptor [Phenylobacterium sp.]